MAIPSTALSSSDMEPARAVTSPSLATSKGTPHSAAFLSEDCFLLDAGRALPVAGAKVEDDSVALEVASERDGSLLGGRDLAGRRHDHLKGALVGRQPHKVFLQGGGAVV